MPKSPAVMLPGNAIPRKYQLTLAPDLNDFTFKGSESIQVEVLEPSTEITLNASDIQVQSCELTASDGSTQSADVSYDEKEETVIFKFDSTIPEGSAELRLEFTGELNDKLRGFYRSHYTDVNGDERYMATTQFEPTDARLAFPCWDEPSVKATFEVTLEVPSDMVAVSNMPSVNESEVRPGVKAVRFAETPIMSTYLLAFIVGDLASIEGYAENGTLIRIWSTRGREHQGQFALDTSIKLLSYFNEYFGIPFPLPKLDHLAIPDFAAGAMENWGAITYRETALLVDAENSSAGTRQQVASIISHEMAHMWFGDLVTMAWWNGLWLNESFASWMGDKAVDNLFPEWRMWTQFLSYDTNRALSLDGLKNSHPIEQEVKHPSEIEQLFDAISYSKGGSILRMLEQFLGEETFRRGLHDYLIDHQYANATTRDLWDALGAASGQPVATIMDSWVMQMGYPVVEANIGRKEGSTGVALSQRRFVYESISGEQEDEETLWYLPISAKSASHQEPVSKLMDNAEDTIDVETSSADEWVKLNHLHTGFYRVKYEEDDLQKLTEPIRNLELPAADRLGIQNDAYALVRAGLIPATSFLTIAEAYKNEDDASVCSDLASNLGGLDNLLWDEDFYTSYQAFARSIFKPIGDRVGWDAKSGEGHLDALLRSTVLNQLGEYDDDGTLREASSRFQRFIENPANVKPDIRSVVYSLAGKTGDRAVYDKMWELRNNTPLQEEKVRFMMGLSQFQQSELLEETLERSLGSEVRVHDTITFVTFVAGNRYGRDISWQFLKDRWDEFDRRYGEGGFGLMRLVSIVSGFTTPEMHEDVERFFHNHPAPAAERSIRQSLERINLNIAWLERNRDELAQWFVG